MKHIITSILISLIFSATSISNFSLKLSNEAKLEETKSVIKLNSKIKRANYTDSTYDVFYDCSGGIYNSTVVSFSETVIADSLLTEPDRTKMHKNYASFDGWYLIDGTAWNFSEDTVTQDVTLRAKWNWVDLLDLLNCNLSTDRQNQSHFELNIVEGTSSIRFVCNVQNPTASRNKGRICLGEIKFISWNIF